MEQERQWLLVVWDFLHHKPHVRLWNLCITVFVELMQGTVTLEQRTYFSVTHIEKTCRIWVSGTFQYCTTKCRKKEGDSRLASVERTVIRDAGEACITKGWGWKLVFPFQRNHPSMCLEQFKEMTANINLEGWMEIWTVSLLGVVIGELICRSYVNTVLGNGEIKQHTLEDKYHAANEQQNDYICRSYVNIWKWWHITASSFKKIC